jgi:hypothetical protein
LFGKAVDIVKILLSRSRYVKALEHMSMEEAFKALPEVDTKFLSELVGFL